MRYKQPAHPRIPTLSSFYSNFIYHMRMVAKFFLLRFTFMFNRGDFLIFERRRGETILDNLKNYLIAALSESLHCDFHK